MNTLHYLDLLDLEELQQQNACFDSMSKVKWNRIATNTSVEAFSPQQVVEIVVNEKLIILIV